MGLISAAVDVNPVTLSCNVGDRLVCIAWSRDGSTAFAVTPNAGGASWANRVTEATLSGNDTARRSLAIAELVPVSAVGSVQFTATWSGGGGATDAIWLRVQEGGAWEFAGSTVANSGAGTTTSQGTGSTAALVAGDVLAVAGAAIRSGGTNPAAWSTTTVNPALVGGGNALLDEFAGTGEGGNAGAAGYLSAVDQISQAWSDSITIDTARMVTAALAVWVQPAAGGDETTADPFALGLTYDAPTAVADFEVDAEPAPQAVAFGQPTVAANFVTTAEPFNLALAFGQPAVAAGFSATAQPFAVAVAFHQNGIDVEPALPLPATTTVLPDPTVATELDLTIDTDLPELAVLTDLPALAVLTTVEG